MIIWFLLGVSKSIVVHDNSSHQDIKSKGIFVSCFRRSNLTLHSVSSISVQVQFNIQSIYFPTTVRSRFYSKACNVKSSLFSSLSPLYSSFLLCWPSVRRDFSSPFDEIIGGSGPLCQRSLHFLTFVFKGNRTFFLFHCFVCVTSIVICQMSPQQIAERSTYTENKKQREKKEINILGRTKRSYRFY